MNEDQRIPVLDEVSKLTGRIAYAQDYELDANVLAIALTHVTDCVTTVPRVLFTGARGKGKTTMLNLAERLTFNAEDTSDAITPALLKAVFGSNREDGCTIIQDEVHILFGPSGMKGTGLHIRSILNRGYEAGKTIPIPVGRGAIERIPVYAPVFMAGIGDHCVPDDLYDRSIRIRMVAKPDSVKLLDSRSLAVKEEVNALREPLHRQMRAVAGEIESEWREYGKLHPKLTERKGEIWGPLFVIAKVAGGDWPERIKRAFEIMACDGGEDPMAALLPGQLLLLDMASVFTAADAEFISVRELAAKLLASPERGQRYRNYGEAIWRHMYDATGVKATVKKIPGTDNETVRVRFAADVVPAAEKLLEEITPEPEEAGEAEIDLW